MTYRTNNTGNTLALGLGWFSIGLGLLELLAPRRLARAIGMEGKEALLGAYGVREIATGIGILSASDKGPWIWGRVGGDALDVGTLLAGLPTREGQANAGGLSLALLSVTGLAVLDLLCAQALRAERTPVRDYSSRSGLPWPAADMRGAARNAPVPRDMRTPEALRPYSAR